MCKMLHFSDLLFFSTQKKIGYKPLQTLGFLTLHATHQMLHQCNILRKILIQLD